MRCCRVVAPAFALGFAFTVGVAAGSATSAAAQPVASERFDLDRDGRAEEIRIERDGSLAVVSGRSGTIAAWKPLLAGDGVERGEIQVATGTAVAGHVVILALARAGAGAAGGAGPGGGRSEALAAEWRGGSLHELWRGEVGPQGTDGESTLYVEAGQHGLVRYSGRAGVARCDGETSYLYAEKFDFAGRRGRFRPVDQMPRIPADAPELIATRVPPPGVPAGASPIDFRVLAASSQIGAAGAGDLVAPTEIDDRDLASAWVEGRAGFGRGEFVTARASLDRGLVRAIRLVPGHAASARTFARYNRLKKVGLLVGRERAYQVVFPQDPARVAGLGQPYWIVLPEPVAADCVSLVVIDVYAGQGAGMHGGDTAISELAVLTEMDLAPDTAAASLAAAVASGGREGEQAWRVLPRLGSAAEGALLAEAHRPRAPAEAVLRVRRVLADLPGGAPELAAGLADADLHPADAERFGRALAAIGRPAVAPVAAILAGRTGDDSARSRAAQVLGRIRDPAALAALVAVAGTGSREVRRQVAAAIGGRPANELEQLVAFAQGAEQESEAQAADLWRAVGSMLRTHPPGDARSRAVAALADRLAGAHSYELRYRLLEAAGGLDEPKLVAGMVAELEGPSGADAGRGDAPGRARPGPLRRVAPTTAEQAERTKSGPVAPTTAEQAERTALRRVAAAALGRSRAPGAVPALIRAARDPDPGVRAAVAEALGRQPGMEGEETLGRQLAGDRWPRVRWLAAAALGTSCGRPAPAAALQRAALGDSDLQVRRAALSSLAACQAAGAVPFFLSVAADRSAPAELRTQAIRLVGSAGDRAAVRPLVDLVASELDRIGADERAAATAAAGAYALGELGDPAAVPVLMRAARTVSSPEVQAAAAGALGWLCPSAALPVLGQMAQSAEHQVAAPARAALRRCQRPRSRVN